MHPAASTFLLSARDFFLPLWHPSLRLLRLIHWICSSCISVLVILVALRLFCFQLPSADRSLDCSNGFVLSGILPSPSLPCPAVDFGPVNAFFSDHRNVSHHNGLLGGVRPSASVASCNVDSVWTLPHSPLPNLGNTCWFAALTQLFRAVGIELPCVQSSWRDTVRHLSELGFHDGSQQDPRCLLGSLAASFPGWDHHLSWTFSREAVCSACGFSRLLPGDLQSVVDLPLIDDPTSLPVLLRSALSVGEASLDCAQCGRVPHSLSEPSVALPQRSAVFHVRRSVGGIKSRSIVHIPITFQSLDRVFSLAAAIVHIGQSPDSGHYITLLPPSDSVPGWTCLDDSRCYMLAAPCASGWHLQRDATILLYTVSDLVSEPSPSLCCDPSQSLVDLSSLQLISANITSWFSGWPQLLSDHLPAGPCVWTLSETHLSSSAARACVRGLHRIGLYGVFKCGSLTSQGSKECKSSGVSTSSGVAVVSNLPLREVPWSTVALQNLASEGRLLHCTCALSGRQPLHIVVFYGVAGGSTNPSICRQNEEFLTDIAEECMSWGQVPIVLCGDFNMKLDDSLAVTNLLLYGRWLDVAAEHARRCGTPVLPPTCFSNPTVSKGTRIDGVFLSPSLAKCFVDLSYPDSGLPTHQPLVVDLSVVPLNAFVVKHKSPVRAKSDFPVPSTQDCDNHAEKLWRSVAGDWQRARNCGQPCALWPLLTRVADQFYRWFAQLPPSNKSPCRGLPGPPCLIRVAPPRCRVSNSATSILQAARQRFVRALEHVARLRLKLAEDVTCASRFHEFQHHWSKVADRAPRFVDLSLWQTLFGSCSLRVSEPMSWPSYANMLQLISKLEAESALVLKLEKSQRLSSWRQSCRSKWRDPCQKRFLYSWIRDAWPPCVASVIVPETNQISMDPDDVERVLWQKWQPIFCPSPDQEGLPDFDAFWDRFGGYVVRAPVVLPSLTGDRLRSVILRMSNHAAGGADGWTTSEIKTWPSLLFSKLADFLNDVEISGGDWPEELLLQVVSLVPKDDTGDDQRPITVSCLVYRAWAAVRAQDLCDWQEQWAHASQWGYRRGKRSVDPAWTSSAAAEHAWLCHSHRVGFSLDLAKAFDRIPHKILYHLLVASGVPVNFCDTWLGAIRGAKKYLKSAYGLGRAFHVNRGLPQGDALACFGMNLIMSVWSRAVTSEVPVAVRSFADDATIEVEDPDPGVAVDNLQSAITITEQFTSLSGQLPNIQKCFTWATSKRGRKALADVTMHGKTVKQRAHAKDLGCQALFFGPPRNGVLQSRFQKARKAAFRVRCAPLRLDEKTHLVTGSACALATYGIETCPIGDGACKRLRGSVVAAIWGLRRQFRSAHAILLLFTQSHLTDPIQAQMCQSFLTLQRCLRSDPVMVASWESWWHTASLRIGRPRGPITLLWSLLSRLGWSWLTPWSLCTHDNTEIDLLTIDTDAFGHLLRDAARRWAWQEAFSLHKHFDGVQHAGVDRAATLYLCNLGLLSPPCLRMLRSILVDAVWTLSRLCHAGRAASSLCSCGQHQDTEHFFWSCPELAELQSKHSALFTLRAGAGPWPKCLELCGLVPAEFRVPDHSRQQLAFLVQSYLLDVVRRSWELGWPDDTPDVPKVKPPEPSQADTVVLKLPIVVPKLSSTTFPWPPQFAQDLLDFLRTLSWSKTPTRDGITWVELAVNFEIVVGKALPKSTKKRRGKQVRSYGEKNVPLLESPENLYMKVLTMSNACRCLARLLGTPVVVGRQCRYQTIRNLPGKYRFNGLDRRPNMNKASETQEALHTCLHERVNAAIACSSADISSGSVSAQNPVAAAAKNIDLLKWSVPQPVPDAQPPKAPAVQKAAVPCIKPTMDIPAAKHDVVKVNNRWTCRKCPCSASYSNSARFKNARCLGDHCHHFSLKDALLTCTKCGETAANDKEMHGKLPFPCPGKPPETDSQCVQSKKNAKKDVPTHDLHDVFRGENKWLCRNCPASSSLKNSGRFRTAECFGDRSHQFLPCKKPSGFKCEKCGDCVTTEKQKIGKMTFPCPGASNRETAFVHVLPAKPDGQGRYVCKTCKRSTVKASLARFSKSLCFGAHASNRAEAIRASRCAAGLSKTGLPSDVAPLLQAFRKSDVNLEPD